MLEKQFERLGKFIEKKYKPIIVIWIVIFIMALPFAIESLNLVNYNVEFTGSNHNSMSQRAQNVYNAQFSNNSDSNGTAVVVFVNSSFNSSQAYEFWIYFNSTYKSALKKSGFSSLISPFNIYDKFVDSYSKGAYNFYKNVENASGKLNSSYRSILDLANKTNQSYRAINSLDLLYKNTYMKLKYGVNTFYTIITNYYQLSNFTSFVIFGIPLSYLNIYLIINQEYPSLTNQTKDVLAENQILNQTHNFYGNNLSNTYFNYFYNSWNNTSGQLNERLNYSISNAYYETLQLLNGTEQEVFGYVYRYMNTSTYENITARKGILLDLTYDLGYNYGKTQAELYNATFETFANNGNVSLLPFNLTLAYLNTTNQSVEMIFNESASQFLNFIIKENISENLVINQLLSTQLGNYIGKVSENLGMTQNVFINLSLSNDIKSIEYSFLNVSSGNLTQLSNLTLLSPRTVAWNLLNNSTSDFLYLTSSFLGKLIKYSPFAEFNNAYSFINYSVTTNGNISELVPYNSTNAGLKLNYTLFGLLVPPDFGGYTLIIAFNQSSLNSSQLITVNQYLSDLQSNFPAIKIYYTGPDEIAHGLEQIANISLIESMIIGIFISIIIVGIYFRSWKLAFIPMGFFVFSMTITLAISYIIFGMILHSSLSFIVTTLGAILILGLSVDYTVYIINRFMRTPRDERVKTTVQWAGHAVFTSSIIVIISYLVMALFNIPLIGDGGYLNSLGIAVTLLVALTLLPSFLNYFHRDKVLKHTIDFQKVARVSRNHKYMLTGILVVLLIGSLIIYEITPTTFDLLSLIPSNPGKIGYYFMVKEFGFDAFDYNFVILKFNNPIINGTKFNATDMNLLKSVETTILNSGYVVKMETVNYPYTTYIDVQDLNLSYPSAVSLLNVSKSFVGRSPDYVLINIYMKNVSFSQDSINNILSLDNELKDTIQNLGISYWVGGPSQSLLDSSAFIKASTYTIVEVLSVIIFAVLSYQLSALLTPLRLLLNVGVSTLTSVAFFYIIFFYILHYPIIVFGPLFVIVTLFGVGLDYDIFLITRTREEVFKGKNDEEAIEEALKENAGVIMALGLIISGVFGALSSSPIQIIKEIGFSITIGVLFETMISWMFLIPSLMLIMKKYNWWPSKIRGDKN